MEALGQLLVAMVTFIFEVTIHAVVFIFHLVMAIFSPRYREKLRDDWDTSPWRRFSIVLGVTMYSAALILALLFWLPALSSRTPEVADADKKPTVTIEFSSEEVQRMKHTKEIDELVDVAGGIMMRKLAERRVEAEKAGTGQPAAAPDSKPVGSDKPQPESEGRSR
jgi:heme/copper-type cytochrome/quinol oxidase subunit 2